MAYDGDDDLFGEEFDFVDDDDAADDRAAEPEESCDSKPKRRGRGRDKDGKEKEKPAKPASRAPKRAKGAAGGAKSEPRRPAAEPERPTPAKPPVDRAPVGYIMDDEPLEDDVVDSEPEPSPEPAVAAGPPADHVVHVYEYGVFKRTIDRKFTDEEAVGFAEEYTRTGKAYGRYAIATPEDEEPAPTFAGAAKG